MTSKPLLWLHASFFPNPSFWLLTAPQKALFPRESQTRNPDGGGQTGTKRNDNHHAESSCAQGGRHGDHNSENGCRKHDERKRYDSQPRAAHRQQFSIPTAEAVTFTQQTVSPGNARKSSHPATHPRMRSYVTFHPCRATASQSPASNSGSVRTSGKRMQSRSIQKSANKPQPRTQSAKKIAGSIATSFSETPWNAAPTSRTSKAQAGIATADSSTFKCRGSILPPQCRQTPFCSQYDSKGIISEGPRVLLQVSQWERPDTNVSPRGIRRISTPRKLPINGARRKGRSIRGVMARGTLADWPIFGKDE